MFDKSRTKNDVQPNRTTAKLCGMSRKRSHPTGTPFRVAFALRLAALRTSYGCEEQKEFAEKLGLASETYRRYERAETEPNLETLDKIRELTGVSLDYLVSGLLSPISGRGGRRGEWSGGQPLSRNAASGD
jgi:DNA-binding XRE family transcriptional regulator